MSPPSTSSSRPGGPAPNIGAGLPFFRLEVEGPGPASTHGRRLRQGPASRTPTEASAGYSARLWAGLGLRRPYQQPRCRSGRFQEVGPEGVRAKRLGRPLSVERKGATSSHAGHLINHAMKTPTVSAARQRISCSSTLRFSCLPSAVELSAMNLVSPKPLATRRAPSMPSEMK